MARTTSATDAAFWGGVLILAVVVLAAALWFLRHRLFSAASRREEDFFSLQHLRKMLAEGQITPDEFERLKASALEAARLAPFGKSSGRAEPARGPDADPNAVK